MGGLGGLGRPLTVALAAGLALLFVACASSPRHRVEHVVRPGENLYRISHYYGVSVDSIVRANRIRDVTELPVGKRLRIPGTRKPVASQPIVAPEGSTSTQHGTSRGSARARAKRESNLAFTWPARGRLSSRFGRRNGRPHEGIDIAAARGTAIKAAESGRVIHSGWGLGAYGRVVIVKHSGRYSTVYAHNHKNHVDVGDFVEKGQTIAQVGKSGNASGAHVHFEIRRDRSPQDPIPYLP